MTIEITNSPYVGQNPVEAFISELIADAQHCNPAKPWKRIPPDENSAQEGFKLADGRGCETFLPAFSNRLYGYRPYAALSALHQLGRYVCNDIHRVVHRGFS